MPIEFDNQGIDLSGVSDQRSSGGGFPMGSGGMMLGGGTGLVGIVIYLLVAFLGGGGGFGGSTQQLDPGSYAGGSDSSVEDLNTKCKESGAIGKYTDCRLVKVYNVATTVWQDEFAKRNQPFERPTLSFFSNRVNTGCGPASAQVGPFYCPADQRIYFELNFLNVLQKEFGAAGEFAQAYIVAHEYGHHLQTLLGTERKVRAVQQRNPSQANEYSVRMELQADCYAGVWSKLADASDKNGINLTKDNIAEALNAAGAVGDDRIQEKTQGRVSPESFTHGSAAQRQEWFNTGYTSGDMARCDTFAN